MPVNNQEGFIKTLGLAIERNYPLSIALAHDVVSGLTLFPPLVWLEVRGWRDVKPGSIAPPGVVPSRWIDDKEFFLWADDETIMQTHGMDWNLFLRKPTDEESHAIQWRR